MTNADLRDPMIQPYDRYDYELIIKEVKPNEFVYRRTENQSYLNNNNINDAETVKNNNIYKKPSRSASPVSPVSEDEPVSPISEYSISSTPKAFGRLPNFLSRRSRRRGSRRSSRRSGSSRSGSRRSGSNRKTLRRRSQNIF